MAAKKKSKKKIPQKKAKPQEKRPAARAKPKAVVADELPDKPEAEKKVYSHEEQEILRRKRFTLDDDETTEVKAKKPKGVFPEDEELAGDAKSYDSDEYFYEETTEDKYA